MTSGEVIERLLRLHNKTQKDLALYLVDNDLSKCRPATVNEWIKKGKKPSGKNLIKTAEFFNTSVDVILGNAGTGDWKDPEFEKNIATNVKELEIGLALLERMGYSFSFNDDNAFISWENEERILSIPQFELLFKRIYKLLQVIQSEIEDVY